MCVKHLVSITRNARNERNEYATNATDAADANDATAKTLRYVCCFFVALDGNQALMKPNSLQRPMHPRAYTVLAVC